jgi:predicted secreted protein
MFVRTFFGMRLVPVAGLAAAIALAGCSTVPSLEHSAASPPAAVLANITTPTTQLTVDCDAFARQPKTTAHVQLKTGEVLAVTLCSNASTGFAWQQPDISGDALGVSAGVPASGAADAGAIVPPVGAMRSSAPTSVAGVNETTLVAQGPSDPVGTATSTTFMLTAQHAGTATATLSYSRPWAGGEKGVWEYTIDVTVV